MNVYNAYVFNTSPDPNTLALIPNTQEWSRKSSRPMRMSKYGLVNVLALIAAG